VFQSVAVAAGGVATTFTKARQCHIANSAAERPRYSAISRRRWLHASRQSLHCLVAPVKDSEAPFCLEYPWILLSTEYLISEHSVASDLSMNANH